MSGKSLAAAGVLLLWAALAAAGPGFVVIVNAANPVSQVSAEVAAKIFLKRLDTWQDGQRTKPVDLPAASTTREAFSREVLGQSPRAIEEMWQKQIFSGRDVPPPRKASESEVIDYVARYPGAIGYVAAGSPLAAGVKVIQIKGDR